MLSKIKGFDKFREDMFQKVEVPEYPAVLSAPDADPQEVKEALEAMLPPGEDLLEGGAVLDRRLVLF